MKNGGEGREGMDVEVRNDEKKNIRQKHWSIVANNNTAYKEIWKQHKSSPKHQVAPLSTHVITKYKKTIS